MIDKINNYLKNKKILLLGFGKEGQSTYKYIRKFMPDIYLGIADAKKISIDEILKEDEFVHFYFGENYFDAINDYDLVIKSPGISLKDLNIEKIQHKLTSQCDLFFKFSNHKIIGVTGTKGKSTTSSLIAHILSEANHKVKLIGNIGVPAFDILEEIQDDTKLVFELSSHQLEYINHSPNVAVILNIYEEHLDHYNSFLDYQKAKFNICKFQKNQDCLVYNSDNQIIADFISENSLQQKLFPISFEKDFEAFETNYNIRNQKVLIGKHNLFDIMIAITVLKILGLQDDLILRGLNSFKSLPHRMEYVGKYNDIHFYNDSIATIPEATISAIESIDNINTLIVGGFDRGINYNEFSLYLLKSKLENVVFLPGTGEIILKKIKENNQGGKPNFFLAKDLEEAVKITKEVTKKGYTCLFSPAAASYGYYKNFEERGNAFKEFVKKIN